MAKNKSEEQLEKVAGQLLNHITKTGWVSDVDTAQWAEQEGIDGVTLHKAIRLLDRQRMITRKDGADRKSGWEAIIGGGRPKTYGKMSEPLVLRMVFQTPPLGQVSGEDEEGVHRFLRGPEGQIMFTPAEFRAMLVKAYRQCGFGDESNTSESAVGRVFVQFRGLTLPEGVELGALPVKPRRPLNVRDQAVGVVKHESLPPGSVAEWVVEFPMSHFTPEQFVKLLLRARAVGFSPAGSGRSGGNAGLFEWEKAPEVAEEG